jgi:glycosyltransferase involved in cell wall biosynthesis
MNTTPVPEQLRIAMVLDSWDDAANGGVVSTRRFAGLLRERGHTVTVVATGAPEPGKVSLPSFYVPLAGGVMRKMRFPFGWPDRRILRETFSRQDLVHVQFPFYLGMRSVRLAREMGVPVVSTFHVQAEHLLFNVGIRSQALVNAVYRLFMRTVYDRSDRVICPSAFAEEELRTHGLRAPSVVISNGVPPEFQPSPRETGPDFGGKFLLLSVGRLAREKRHDLVIEAVRGSRHENRIQLVILGAGPLREELEALGKGLTNPPVFRFLPTAELVPWYSAADLCVHASEVEVECMSVLEAMGCGTPCLIARSSRSATRQFALSDQYLFEAGSLQDLVSKLDRLIAVPHELERARTASRQAAEAYRIEQSVERLLGVYREVVAAGRTGR